MNFESIQTKHYNIFGIKFVIVTPVTFSIDSVTLAKVLKDLFEAYSEIEKEKPK